MNKMINPEMGKAIDETIVFLVKKYNQSGHNSKPVILHSLCVSFYLLEHNYDLQTIQAAILHDLLEDSEVKKEDIQRKFGKEIANIVDSLTFRADIEDRERQYRELFLRTKKAGKSALIVKCADIYINSLYINLINEKEREIFLLNKMKYFLDLSKNQIGSEPVWSELKEREKEEVKRILEKCKTVQ